MLVDLGKISLTKREAFTKACNLACSGVVEKEIKIWLIANYLYAPSDAGYLAKAAVYKCGPVKSAVDTLAADRAAAMLRAEKMLKEQAATVNVGGDLGILEGVITPAQRALAVAQMAELVAGRGEVALVDESEEDV